MHIKNVTNLQKDTNLHYLLHKVNKKIVIIVLNISFTRSVESILITVHLVLLIWFLNNILTKGFVRNLKYKTLTK